MVPDDIPTRATQALEGTDLDFEVVRFEPPSSAQESADRQGIDLASLLRTIVVRRGADDFVFVLVPGGRQIAWPKLRSHLGVKRISLPDAEEAKAVTGYERGAINKYMSALRDVQDAADRHGNITRYMDYSTPCCRAGRQCTGDIGHRG